MKPISDVALAAALVLFKPDLPGLTAERLQEALAAAAVPESAEPNRSGPRPLPQVLTCEEVAQALGISTRTVTRMLSRGELPVVHVGPRFVRIPREAVERFLTGETARPASGVAP